MKKRLLRLAVGLSLIMALVTGCGSKSASSSKKVDVDLSKLGDTVAYTEIYNMSLEPDKYVGKMVRMTGVCYKYFDQTTKKTYHECTIYDATACCSQGFEFELKNGKYPKDEEKVTVCGKFTKVKGKGYFFCVLKDAVIE